MPGGSEGGGNAASRVAAAASGDDKRKVLKKRREGAAASASTDSPTQPPLMSSSGSHQDPTKSGLRSSVMRGVRKVLHGSAKERSLEPAAIKQQQAQRSPPDGDSLPSPSQLSPVRQSVFGAAGAAGAAGRQGRNSKDGALLRLTPEAVKRSTPEPEESGIASDFRLPDGAPSRTVLSISNVEPDGSPRSPMFVDLGSGDDANSPMPPSLSKSGRRSTITRKRESKGFDQAVRLYSPAESDDPIIPPAGLYSASDSRSPQNHSISPSFVIATNNSTGRWSRNSSVMGSMQMSEATHSDDTSDDELKHTAERDDREASPAVTPPPQVTFNVDPHVCLAAEAEKEQKNESLGEIQVAECDDDTGDSSDFSQDEPPPRKLSSQMKAGLASGPDRDEDVDFLEVIDECAAEQLLSLDLFELGVSEIPSTVFAHCRHITCLDLSSNELESLPSEIGLLASLEKLTLKSNSLSCLPDELGNCLQLTHLYADQNQLATLPDTLRSLQNLSVVGLDWNELSGFPECLCAIPGLQMLYMVENPNVSLPPAELWTKFEGLVLSIDNSPRLQRQAEAVIELCGAEKIDVQWNRIYPDLIMNNLYLGSLRSAQDVRIYEELEITYLASIGRELSVVLRDGMKHIQCNVDDLPDSDLSCIFDTVHDFIDEALALEQGCLVHCFKGQSRSATIVITYLMKKLHVTRDLAIEMVKERRPMINPNAGFMSLMLRYESTLGIEQD